MDNPWPVSFGPLSDPSVFEVIYPVEYLGGFSYFTSHATKKRSKNAATLVIIIMHHTGVEPVTDEVIYQDFRVHRNAIQLWLEYLVQNHLTFHSHQVAVDYTQLDQLQC